MFKDISPTTRKYSKTFHQQPEKIQRILRLQNCLSRKSSTTFRKFSKTFWGNQQQQPAAATSNSNQQQQSATATSSNNQQQQPAAAISNSNQQLPSYKTHIHNPRRPPLVITTVPSRDYVLLEVDLRLAARLRVQPPLSRPIFVIFNFSKIPFLRFSPFC